MYFFGHIGPTLLLGFMLFLPMVFLLIGSVLPDIVDKPLFLLGLTPSGRYIAHTLLFVVISFLAALITTRKILAGLGLAFGVMMHLLGDATNFVPWLYPFVDYTFPVYEGNWTLIPAFLMLEVVGFVILLAFVKYRSKLDKIRNKLKFHK